jgi:Holliday junction resolvase RusA-like endonuclease
VNLPIRLVIAGIPAAKGRPRITTRGGSPRAFTPAKTRAYEGRVADAGHHAMEGADPFDQALFVTVTAFVAMPQSLSRAKREAAIAGDLKPVTKPDVDNYAKAAIDGLNGIVFRDDSVVSDLLIRKRYSAQPRLEIIVEAA